MTVRSERVLTNLRCNQNCTFCTSRRPADDPTFIRKSAVEERIHDAVASGAREVVLTGGEPTLRRDLAQLIAHARAAGAERVVLETNATLVDGAELSRAGLDRVLVNLAGTGEWLDEVTRDPGGFAASVRGIEALLVAGIVVDVQAAIVRSTLDHLAELPEFLRARFGDGVRTLYLVLPTSSPDERELVDWDTAGRIVREVEARARVVALPLKIAPGSGPAPCVHGRDPRIAHVYSLTAGGRARADHVQLPPCRECLVRDRCSGIPSDVVRRFGTPTMTPVGTDRGRRRLSLISTVDEQIARELVTPNRYRDPIYGDVSEDVIRVVFQCNQACRFCFVSTHLPAAGNDAIEAAIRAAGARGHRVTLSGGEPTLHPDLVGYVRLAKSVSKLPVLLQTNAIRLADQALAMELAEAGLDEAFVSLHGATAAVSDAITGAPGTFDKTVRGLDQLAKAGVALQINFVICQANVHELSQWVELLALRWPRAFANVSFVAPSTDMVPREHALIPRYEEVLPRLAAAVTLAESKGVAIGGFESMCGIPLCLVPSSIDRYFDLAEVPPGFDAGEFVKPSACQSCALASRCYGIRRGYVELHGEGELRPVAG